MLAASSHELPTRVMVLGAKWEGHPTLIPGWMLPHTLPLVPSSQLPVHFRDGDAEPQQQDHM